MTGWFLVGIALIGTVLNIKQNRMGFYFWAISNAGLAYSKALKGDWPMATLFVIYLILSMWGIIEWGRKKEHDNTRCSSRIWDRFKVGCRNKTRLPRPEDLGA